MGNWYVWLIMAGAQIVVMILNIFERGSDGIVNGFYIFMVLVYCALGIAQYFCEKKGESGKKLLKKINIGAIILILVVFGVFLLLAEFG